jgi:hypothetical protein
MLALAGCAQGAQQDLPSIKEARSLAAEWALVNEQAANGRLNSIYVDSMRSSVREQLLSLSQGFTQQDAPYVGIVGDLLSQPDDAPALQLRARAEALKTIEDSLESA